jgi:cysteine desulfurase
MDETIDLNANGSLRPCGAALERMRDPVDTSLVKARQEPLYDLAGAAKEDRFVFTSSSAEAVNQVLFSVFLEVSRKEGKCHFIASAIEDAPTMQMMKRLEELGCFVKIAPVNERGEIDLPKLAELINPRTALVSVTMAHGLTGAVQPFEEIAKIAKDKGVLLHLDAAYALGKIYFSFEETGADYLTFSGPQIHSVAGSGGLFAKKDAPLVPLILGGGGMRGGSFDAPSFFALSASAAQASLYLDRMSLEIARLRDRFEREIAARAPGSAVLYKDSLRIPNTTAIAFPKAHGEALHYLLRRKKIEASVGGEYCQLLSRLCIGGDRAISFSLSRMNTEEEILRAAQLIAETAAMLGEIAEGVFDGAV